MIKLWIDLETFSLIDLKACGLYKYAEQVEILLVAWAINDGPVRVDEGITEDFLDAAMKCDVGMAHNVEFERTVLSKYHDWFGLEFPWYCTMGQARRHGLPGQLGKLCEVLNIEDSKAKLKEGLALIKLFCMPQKDGSRATKATHPAQWAKFKEYAGSDILAMREVHRIVPKWNDRVERDIWNLDAKINSRGFAVDIPFASQVMTTLASEKVKLAEKTVAATDGQVEAATQRDKLLAYLLAEHGVDLPDMQASTIERRLNDQNLPDAVRDLLNLRVQSSKTSASKYATLLKCSNSDGRLRGTMAYCGAMRTGRWAGQKFQPHNLPRLPAGIDAEDVAHEIECMKADIWDLVCDRSYPEMAATAVRGCIVAPPGKKLLVGDYANIEGRIGAWLAGEEWKLQAFRDYDAGTGPDLYKLAYARAFNVPHETVTKFQRQLGKVMELFLLFSGGVGAFITGAETYGIDLAEMAERALPNIPPRVRMDAHQFWLKTLPEWDEAKQKWKEPKFSNYGLSEDVFIACDSLKRLWREAHPKVTQFWQDLGDASKSVAGRFSASQTVGKVTFDTQGVWMRILLPSGRYLCYPGAQLSGDKVSYMGQNQYTRQWCRLHTYHGKICENLCQAISRDFLKNGLLEADKAGYDIVLHVHDEGVAEDDKDLEGFLACLATLPAWAEGLPLTAAGFETNRYKKE